MQRGGYVEGPAGSLNATFAALADPTRRAILARLADGERTVTELAEPFSLSQPAISKHLKVLERAHLISRDRDAQRRPSRLEAAPLAEASQWLERYREFWQTSFQRLDDLLSSLQPPGQIVPPVDKPKRKAAAAGTGAASAIGKAHGQRTKPSTQVPKTATRRRRGSRGEHR